MSHVLVQYIIQRNETWSVYHFDLPTKKVMSRHKFQTFAKNKVSPLKVSYWSKIIKMKRKGVSVHVTGLQRNPTKVKMNAEQE
jgi:hypothetical protein